MVLIITFNLTNDLLRGGLVLVDKLEEENCKIVGGLQ